MEKQILNIQILLEISLNQRVSGDVEASLNQIMNLYLRKLNCFAVAIYRRESLDLVLPQALKNNDIWMQKLANFSQELKANKQDPIFITIEKIHFYGFQLHDFGWLVLIRKNCLAETLFFELNKVVQQLGRDLYQAKEEQRLKLLQEIFDKASDGIQIAEESGALYYVNQIASKRLGIDPKNVGSYHVCDVEKNFLNNIEAWKNHVDHLKIEKKIIFQGEHINQDSGNSIPVELTINLIDVKNKNFIIASARDISKRVKQEQKLKETNQKLASVFNEMSDIVWSLRFPELEALFVTPSVEHLFEIKSDVFMNDISWWQKVIHEQDCHVIDEIKRSLIKKGRFSASYRIKTPSGAIKWISNKGKFVYDQNLQPIRIDGVITDRTKQYLAQETLDQEVKLQEVLIDIASTYINLNPKDVENTINQSLQKMGLFVSSDRAYIFDYNFDNETTSNTYEWCQSGISPEIQNLQDIPNHFFPQWVEQHQKGNAFYVEDVDALEADADAELKSILKQQGIKSLIAIPMLDGDELIGFVGFDSVKNSYQYTEKEQRLLFLFAQMLINIRNRQKWDNQLRIQEEKYRNIIANMYLGLLEVDLNDQIVYANQTFCEISGYESDELKGKKAGNLLVDDKYKDVIVEKTIKRIEDRSDSYELEIFNKKKQKRWWFVSGAPNYDDKGQLIGSIGIHLDITKQKNLEIQKEQLLKKLEKQNEQLNEYAQIVSHDLKSPLRSIHALITWIKEDNLKEFSTNTLQFLSMIEGKIEKMDHLIDGILTYSKVDTERNLNESVDLNEVVSNCIKIIHIPESIQIKIQNKLPIITADKFRMQQLFQNLISNSVNYSDKKKGKVAIGSYETETDYTFFVKDNGVGIAKENQEKIFKIFQSFSDSENSTGIGLSIVKRIVDNYMGTITVESELKLGTTFFVKLPKTNKSNKKHTNRYHTKK